MAVVGENLFEGTVTVHAKIHVYDSGGSWSVASPLFGIVTSGGTPAEALERLAAMIRKADEEACRSYEKSFKDEQALLKEFNVRG